MAKNAWQPCSKPTHFSCISFKTRERNFSKINWYQIWCIIWGTVVPRTKPMISHLLLPKCFAIRIWITVDWLHNHIVYLQISTSAISFVAEIYISYFWSCSSAFSWRFCAWLEIIITGQGFQDGVLFQWAVSGPLWADQIQDRQLQVRLTHQPKHTAHHKEPSGW